MDEEMSAAPGRVGFYEHSKGGFMSSDQGEFFWFDSPAAMAQFDESRVLGGGV